VTDSDPLAALAAQLEELRGQLARSQGEIRILRDRLEDSTGQTVNLFVEVKRLRGELAEAVEKRQLKPPPAPCWGVSPEQDRAMHADLARWVDGFLVPNYGDYLNRLPRCLLSHRAAVWELSTLKAEWDRIYADPENGDLQGALAWLDRWLPGVLARLKASIDCDETGCRLTRPR
jgi:hypothetical protein